MSDNDEVYIGDMEPRVQYDRNPSFEESDDLDIWKNWDDGFRAREINDPPYVLHKQVSKCPHCKRKILLNYRARGISFEHVDNRLLVRFLRWVTREERDA